MNHEKAKEWLAEIKIRDKQIIQLLGIIDKQGIEIEKLKAEKLAEVERVTRFIREVVVWTPGGGHTLGCNCGAFWCARRKEVLEAAQAKERE